MKEIKYVLLVILIVIVNISTYGQILYTDFIPDTTITATTSDTTKCFQVDINQDAIMDFTFCVFHEYEFHSPSCCDFFRSWIAANDTNSKIAVGDSTFNYCTTAALNSGVLIDNNFWWESNTYLNFQIYMASCPLQPNVPKFYPVKLFNAGNYYFGWFRVYSTTSFSLSYTVVTLFDMAINLTPNQSIYAGQTVTGIGDNNSVLSKTF